MRRPTVLSQITRGGIFYTLPAVSVFLVFILYPLLTNIAGSLTNSRHDLSISAYRHAFQDPVFLVAIINSIVWVVVCVLAEMTCGFIIAYIIEFYTKYSRRLFRTLFFLPMVITPSVIAFVFVRIYAPDYGLLFGLFNDLGLGNHFPAILGTISTASFGIMIANIWQWSGFFILMYSVGITQLDPSIVDAGLMDGATGISRVRYLILPLLASTHTSLLVLGSIQALQQFPLVYLMTNGGPADASQTLATYIFKVGFSENRFHYAAAIAISLLSLSILVISVEYFVMRWLRSKVD